MSQGAVSTTSKLGTRKYAVEQLASKTMETYSFSSKPPITNVSTSLSHFSSFLHHSTSSYIILHHEFTKERRESQTSRKLGEILNPLESKYANLSSI